MLELRPGSERCDRDLPVGSSDSQICILECTWWVDWADSPQVDRTTVWAPDMAKQ